MSRVLDFDDAVLFDPESASELPLDITAKVTGFDPDWPDGFRWHDRYDWSAPDWLRSNRGEFAYRIIPLTQGYFTIVSKRDYKRLTHYPDGSFKRWHVTVERDNRGVVVKAYACRRGRKGEPKSVFMHREILECTSGLGDHVNGYGLDNRRCNLVHVRRGGANNHNRRSMRDLPVGVELRRNGRYGGIRSVRLGAHSVKTVRSKRTWTDPGPAAQWYLNQLKRLHKRTAWAHDPKSVNYPTFPPTIYSDPMPIRRKQPEHERVEIPF